MGPLDLDAVCHELLDASVEALDTIPDYDASLSGAPAIAYVSPGQPALDCCAQLTVNAVTITQAQTNAGMAAGRRDKTGAVNLVGLNVTITRCLPQSDAQTLGPPEADALSAAAAQTNADAWALWNHLFDLWVAGDLFSMCGVVFWDGMRALQPSDCGGFVLSLRVSLDGYQEAEES